MAKQEYILPGNTDIVGKADHGHSCGARDSGGLHNIVATQRAQYDLVSIRNRALCGCGDAGAGVIGDHADVGRFGVRQCKRGRVGDGLANVAVGTRHRQQQRHAVHAVQRVLGHHRGWPFAATRGGGAGREENDRSQNQQLFDLSC